MGMCSGAAALEKSDHLLKDSTYTHHMAWHWHLGEISPENENENVSTQSLGLTARGGFLYHSHKPEAANISMTGEWLSELGISTP